MSTIDLTVLGLVKQQPCSAYDIQRELEKRNISRWVRVSVPSIYKKVIQLEERGYINASVVREGKMPEKTIYHVTEKGNLYFLELMETLSNKPVNIYLELNAVIVNLMSVPPQMQQKCLQQIADHVEELTCAMQNNWVAKPDSPPMGKSVLQQQIAMGEALQNWILALQSQIAQQAQDTAQSAID